MNSESALLTGFFRAAGIADPECYVRARNAERARLAELGEICLRALQERMSARTERILRLGEGEAESLYEDCLEELRETEAFCAFFAQWRSAESPLRVLYLTEHAEDWPGKELTVSAAEAASPAERAFFQYVYFRFLWEEAYSYCFAELGTLKEKTKAGQAEVALLPEPLWAKIREGERYFAEEKRLLRRQDAAFFAWFGLAEASLCGEDKQAYISLLMFLWCLSQADLLSAERGEKQRFSRPLSAQRRDLLDMLDDLHRASRFAPEQREALFGLRAEDAANWLSFFSCPQELCGAARRMFETMERSLRFIRAHTRRDAFSDELDAWLAFFREAGERERRFLLHFTELLRQSLEREDGCPYAGRAWEERGAVSREAAVSRSESEKSNALCAELGTKVRALITEELAKEEREGRKETERKANRKLLWELKRFGEVYTETRDAESEALLTADVRR